MKLLKANGRVFGIIFADPQSENLDWERDDIELVELATDFTDADTGMARTIENYKADGFVVDGLVMKHQQDKDVLMVLLGDGRAYPLGVD